MNSKIARLLALLILGCFFNSAHAEKPPIQFIFGQNSGTLNTFQGTYTKTMYQDPAITVKVVLSEDEIEKVYQKMVAIDFFHYPRSLRSPHPRGAIVVRTHPVTSYHFKVESAQGITEVNWNNGVLVKINGKDDPQVVKLQELISLLNEIILSKDEIKNLPVPKGMPQ